MRIYGKKTICVTAILVAVATTSAWAEYPYQVAWKAQIGTTESDSSQSVTVDASGNAYMSGLTKGNFGGPNAGDYDAFLSKFDSGGNEVWTTQIGSSARDLGLSVAVDASGNAYISGYTEGDLGGPHTGRSDVFLSKFDSGGNEVWTTHIGTSDWDEGSSVALDASGNAYIGGVTSGDLGGPNAGSRDAFLSKFDPAGNEVWTTQFGTSAYDYCDSIAVDASGNAYVSGHTEGDLGGPNAGQYDTFLSKFDSGGNEVWTSQIGTTSNDRSDSIAVDASGNAYISGYTAGDLGGPNAGDDDAFLSKFDSGGNEVWTTQIGTSEGDWSHSVAVDAFGNAYISGSTWGDLGGPNAGYRSDVFLSKFDSDGNEVWTTQIGSDRPDSGSSVAVGASGNVYISGQTDGNLGGPSAGGADAFLVKYKAHMPLRIVSAVDIAAGFTPSGGNHGLGEITAAGQADVIVEDVDDQQTTYVGGSFEMTASLFSDDSVGGLATGEFRGGALAFRDSGGADLLTGDLIELLLYEVGDDRGMLAGSGLFAVTGGRLQARFADTHGEVFQMFFQVTPSGMDNFSAAFTGFTDITVTPIPEPATLSLLTLGCLSLVRQRKRRACK